MHRGQRNSEVARRGSGFKKVFERELCNILLESCWEIIPGCNAGGEKLNSSISRTFE